MQQDQPSIDLQHASEDNGRGSSTPAHQADRASMVAQVLPASDGPHAQEEEADTLPDSPGALQLVDALLKTPEAVFTKKRVVVTLLALLLLCHLIYGVIVGSYSGQVQWFAAPLKIAAGTLLAGILCLPSLYIFACLSGARIKLGQAISLLAGGLAVTSVLLIGFAPVAFIFSFSIGSLPFIGFVHLMIWLVSIGFGVRYVIRGIGFLEGKNTAIMQVWAMILIVTMLQMCTTLRPIIGRSDKLLTAEKRFFAVHWAEELGKSRVLKQTALRDESRE